MARSRSAPAVGDAVASADAALRAAAARLVRRAGGLAEARLEAELLLAHALGLTRGQLLLRGALDAAEQAAFEALLERRIVAGVPIAYLTGWRAFRALELFVDGRVLVPRPETETLLDVFEELLGDGALPPGPVVDRGTGSGNIALSVCAHRDVLATDISAGALAVAAINRERAPDAQHVWLAQADGLSCLRAQSVAAVLANPPYVEPGELEALPEDVRCHEPRAALVPGEGSAQRMFVRLLDESRVALAPGGWLITEVGAGQAGLVAALASVRGYASVSVRSDLAGIERVVAARRG